MKAGAIVTAALSFSLIYGTISDIRAETGENNGPVRDLAELSVEELMKIEVASVYGASKFEQKVTDAPASVSIVTADDIGKFGYRTLADVLRSVRGFYVTYDRNYNYIGVRGFNRPGDYNTRILLLIDGHRVNDNIYETAPIGTEFPVDISLIDRIEIIRGPSSSLYGTNAFFGVINIITREAVDLQGTEVSGAYGSFDTYNGRVTYGKEYRNGPSVLLSASVMNSAGPHRLYFKEFDDPATNNGIAENVDGDRNYQLYTKLGYRDFQLTGALSSREKETPTGSYGTVFNDQRNSIVDEYSFLNLKYSHIFSGRTEVTARLFYDRYAYNGDYLFDDASPGDPPLLVLDRDYSWGYRWGSEVQVTKTLFDWNKVSVGAEFRDNFRQDQRNRDDSPFLFLDDKRRSNVWAVFLQDEIQFLNNLIFTAGVRYDRYDTFGGTTNPRMGLIFKPFDGTIFKLLYGQAFRAPNAFESYYNDGQTAKDNPDLKPEKIRTFEAVYEQYYGSRYRSSLSGFSYRINDLISQRTDPADGFTHFVNIDKVDTLGIEAELEGKWENGLQGRAAYTFQDTEDAQTGQRLSNSPQHLAKLNLVAPLYRNMIFAGIEEQYTSRRTTLTGGRAPAYFNTNLTLFSRNLLPGLELSASVYNLFDRKYSDPGSDEHIDPYGMDLIPQDGRTFRVKLTYLF